MKTKNLHLILLFALLFGSMRMFAQDRPTAEVWQVSSTITIDGLTDDWAGIPAIPIERPFVNESPTLNSATWKAVWGNDGIYVVVEVNEDTWMPLWLSGVNGWESDHIELYLDVSDPQVDGGGPANADQRAAGNYQVAPDMINAQAEPETGIEGSMWEGIVHANTFDEVGKYCREYFIPWTKITRNGEVIDPKVTTTIGFDVVVVDSDFEGSGHRQRMVWSNDATITSESWNNCDMVGLITFKEGNALVSNATLKSISVNNELIEGFNAEVFNYSAFIPGQSPTNPIVSAVAISAEANVEITQVQNIDGTLEERTATIKVTSADHSNILTYAVVFTSCATSDIDKGVTLEGTTLTANLEFAEYQWVDCNNNFEPIANMTHRVFSATQNGSYAVKITYQGCEYISDCYEITGISITENEGKLVFDVYPNPAQSQLFINSPKTIEKAEVLVMNVLGDIVMQKEMNATNHLMLDMNTLQSGVYHIRIQTNESFIVYKVIKN